MHFSVNVLNQSFYQKLDRVLGTHECRMFALRWVACFSFVKMMLTRLVICITGFFWGVVYVFAPFWEWMCQQLSLLSSQNINCIFCILKVKICTQIKNQVPVKTSYMKTIICTCLFVHLCLHVLSYVLFYIS